MSVISVHHCAIFCLLYFFFFFKQKTAYEMRISDWSSEVCSSDLSKTFRSSTNSVGSRKRLPAPCPRSLDFSCLPSPLGVSPADDRDRRHILVRHPAEIVAEREHRAVLSLPPAGAAQYLEVILEIGRASCRERVCPYVELRVVAGSLK